jgi:uncharacterized protein YcnI
MKMRTRVLSRTATIAGATVAAATAAAAGLAAPAYAHVEVSADKPQAGATNVTLTFVGEAESNDAGIRSERIVLPTGIAPADVTLVKAPTGWKMIVNPDGVTVGGKALPVGRDATVAIRVAKLPDAARLSFKTIETYGDGQIDRWIEIQQEGAAEPDKPAPLLKLRPAAAAAATTTPAPASAAPPTTTAAPAPVVTAQSTEDTDEDDGGATVLWLGVGALVVLAAAGAFYLRRRRGGA